MATISELINFYDCNSKEYEEFLQELICFNGDIPFDIEEVDRAQSAIISTVNNHLNRSQTRYNGLLILDKVLSQCSKDTLSKYCILWMSKATQVLESVHSIPQELSIACKVLGYLIIQSKDIPEIQKQVSMQNVKQLVNVIGNLTSEKKCGPIYYLIAVLLHQYPEVCERFQTSMKKIILSQIDSDQKTLVNASARCYALLAKATERSFKPPLLKTTYTNWTYNQILICNSLHTIMDDLFSDLIELENVKIGDTWELPTISEKNVIQFYFQQKQRFENLCSYLSCMLCGIDKKNSVLPQEILRVLCRGLSIQPSNLKHQNSVKEQMLYLILPKLHIALFDVLNALINGFQEQLIPFGSTILQLLLQTLQWTETVLEHQITISGSKPFRNVRICVYKCLTAWLSNTNSMSGIETVADEYLPSMLKDIVPERNRVLLTIQKTHNLSKRALKRLRDSQYEKGTYLNNGIASTKEHYLDVDICKEALNALQNIFFNCGTLLKQTFFKTIQNTIIPLLYDCYLSCSEQKFYKENPQCRLLLFRVLRALQMNPHSLVPLPTQYSMQMFEMALSDSNLSISQEAKLAIAELEKIVHPHTPPLQLTQTEAIQKEFVADGSQAEHSETIEDTSVFDTENVIDEEDAAPSSNKKLKVTNSNPDESIIDSIENTSQNIDTESQLERTNNNVLETDKTPEVEMTVSIENKNIVENEEVTQITDKLLDEATPVLATDDTSKTMNNTVEAPSSPPLLHVNQENEDSQVEKMDVSEETKQNPENNSEVVKADQKSSSTQNEKEEEEDMLHLFQDIPKDNY
ncbi:proline-, glutamic acid- and leucine-rich protein 1 [Calliopsis andreniformis]|uniref:proline-, glutamic acid- and leucine-rich protein 1 n=1 Tax=Calliopsis andreniformis TaxID=337506 RepID=UPI003FCEE5FB